MRHAKTVKAAVKTALILCAAAVCVLRFISFKYEAALSPEARRATFAASVICAAVCVLCAVLWVILEKKEKTDS